MLFHEWYFYRENIEIRNIDPEEDWELGAEVDRIAQEVGIRPNRNKNCTIVAMNGDEVVGGVYTSLEDDNDASDHAGEPIGKWDFDVVVAPKWQGYKQVGIQLIRAAEQEQQGHEGMYDRKLYTRLQVVNPKLARVLQHPKFGYQSDGEYSQDNPHLYKY